MKRSAINRRKIKDGILKLLNTAKKPFSTDEIAKNLGISWHTAIRHCLDLEIDGKLSKFIIGRISAWQIKNE
ncbi:MAG: HTH domain-containing protein [Nanoarchaeota archaeon]